jgi:hypothetical protein
VRPTRLASIIFPALAVIAVSLPLASSAAASTTSAMSPAATAKVTVSAAAHRPTVAVYDCLNQPVVRPKTFGIFCDGSNVLVHLAWTSWTFSMATGTGVEYIDNCDPNCAQGSWQHDNVIVVFWRSVPVPRHTGAHAYTRMTLIYTSPRRGQAQTVTSYPPGAF